MCDKYMVGLDQIRYNVYSKYESLFWIKYRIQYNPRGISIRYCLACLSIRLMVVPSLVMIHNTEAT